MTREPGRNARALLALLGVMALSGALAPPATAQQIVRIAVRPASVELAIGEVILLTAEATFSDGSVANISELVEWRSSNTGVARVNNTRGSKGKVTAKGAGRTSISVRDPVSGVTSGQSGGNALVVVLGRLTAIQVTPPDRRIELGQSRSMTATGTYSNGLTRDLTEQVTWASSNPGVAQVSNEAGRRGRVTALSPGEATITATSSAGVSSSNTGGDGRVRVPATLVGVRVVPSESRLPVGFTLTLDAEGLLNDGSTDDVSNQVTWTSSDLTVATVSNADGSKGEVVALQNGVTVISVVEPATGIGSTPSGGDAIVTVAGTVVAIALNPTEDSLPTGLTRTFTVRATLDDGSSISLSRRDLAWTSSVPAVASVSNERATAGVVTALAKGVTVLSARHPGTGLSTTASGADATLTVLGRMIGIAVRPRTRELFTGQTNRFNAVALLDDGTEARLSRDITFASSDSGVATVSNASGARGDVTGMRKGTARISVTHRGANLSSTNTGGDAAVSVRGRVEALRVDPPRAFYVLGTAVRMRARAAFDDGSSENIGSDVVWTSSDPSIAEIGNESPKKAILESKQVGRITASAVEPVSGISTTASNGDGVVTIVDGLERLRVTESNLELRTADTLQLEASGRFPNPISGVGEPAKVEVEVTDFVEWTSSDPNVVRVDASGRLVAVGLGEATVSARDPKTGISSRDSQGDATFRVIAALKTLKLSPRRITAKMGSGRRKGFTALGIYTDKARIELTDRVQFESQNDEVARVSNDRDRHGLVVPVGKGATMASAVEPITGVRAVRPRRIVVKASKGK